MTPTSGGDEDWKHIVAETSQVIDALDDTSVAGLLKETEERDKFARKENIKAEEDDDDDNGVTSKHGGSTGKNKKQPLNGTHKHKHETGVEAREALRQAVLAQLHVLADDPQAFVHYDKHFKTWSVDHNRLVRLLVQFELERTINARFGPTATRMIRILHEKGKLEEKQIGQSGLIQQKELRTVLAMMQESEYLDDQEVPRDNSRQPSRNIYLWSYDQDHTRRVVIERIYKTMSRLLQRYDFEKQGISGVLDKASRTDVEGHEDEFLTAVEHEGLAKWMGKAEKLSIQLSRLDELVLLFRDCLEPMGG